MCNRRLRNSRRKTRSGGFTPYYVVCSPHSRDPNIHWHVPGHSPLSGDYKGQDEVIAFFTKTQELAAGTFSIAINDMLASKQRVVVLCTVSARRHGQDWSTPEVHVWRVMNGQAVEFREYQGDQQAEDEFWSR